MCLTSADSPSSSLEHILIQLCICIALLRTYNTLTAHRGSTDIYAKIAIFWTIIIFLFFLLMAVGFSLLLVIICFPEEFQYASFSLRIAKIFAKGSNLYTRPTPIKWWIWKAQRSIRGPGSSLWDSNVLWYDKNILIWILKFQEKQTCLEFITTQCTGHFLKRYFILARCKKLVWVKTGKHQLQQPGSLYYYSANRHQIFMTIPRTAFKPRLHFVL